MIEENSHGNSESLKGNKNATKPEADKATSWIQMRVAREEKARFVRQAQNENMKLTEWALKHLREASKDAFK